LGKNREKKGGRKKGGRRKRVSHIAFHDCWEVRAKGIDGRYEHGRRRWFQDLSQIKLAAGGAWGQAERKQRFGGGGGTKAPQIAGGKGGRAFAHQGASWGKKTIVLSAHHVQRKKGENAKETSMIVVAWAKRTGEQQGPAFQAKKKTGQLRRKVKGHAIPQGERRGR